MTCSYSRIKIFEFCLHHRADAKILNVGGMQQAASSKQQAAAAAAVPTSAACRGHNRQMRNQGGQ
jgi:hypothetical protein